MTPSTQVPGWKVVVDRYAVTDTRRGTQQVIITTVLLLVGFVLMYLSLDVGYWLTLILAVPTSGLQVRLFVLFHDAAHGSLIADRRMNDRVGLILGVACYSPYWQWRRRHVLHHATSGNLSRRGWWELPTATVDEYAAMTGRQRTIYRITRSPTLLFTVGAWLFFTVLQRFPVAGQNTRERVNVWATNAALVVLAIGAGLLIGWTDLLRVWVPVMALSASTGMWLFYVQHQFEEAYWCEGEDWNFYDAAMKGSSLLTFPPGVGWFFAGIGFHHVHHLNPRIPNYRLAQAHFDNPQFHEVQTLTPLTAMRCARANLWDGQRMVSFRQARQAASRA